MVSCYFSALGGSAGGPLAFDTLLLGRSTSAQGQEPQDSNLAKEGSIDGDSDDSSGKNLSS